MSEDTPSTAGPAPDDAPPPEKDTGGKSPKGDWTAPLQFFASWRGAIVLLIAAIVGSVFVFPTWPTRAGFLLKPPKALLFVDSPEVYTRERLINDRLQEDLWLREQLEALRDNDRFIRVVESSATRVGMATSDAADDDAASETEPQAAAPGEAAAGRAEGNLVLTFDQEFELNNFYRSLVRQKILENSLDDRHDLLSNSLYILKFDTTMVSVPATDQRGIVRVRIVPPSPFDEPTFTGSGGNDLLDLLARPGIRGNISLAFEKWVDSVAFRLNTRMSELFAQLVQEHNEALLRELEEYARSRWTSAPGRLSRAIARLREPRPVDDGTDPPASAEEQDNRQLTLLVRIFIARKVLAENYRTTDDRIQEPPRSRVLEAMNPEKANPGPVPTLKLVVPDISDIVDFLLSYDPNSTLWDRPTLDVRPRQIVGYVLHRSCTDDADPAEVADILGMFSAKDILSFPYTVDIDEEYRFLTFSLVDSTFLDWIRDAVADGGERDVPGIFQQLSHQLGLEWQVGQVKARMQAPGAAADAPRERAIAQLEACIEGAQGQAIYSTYVLSGLVYFINKIKNLSTYGYAVLPRESPVAILRDIASTNQFLQSSGLTRVSASAERRASGVDLRQVLTTFGDFYSDAAPPAPDASAPADEPPGKARWEPIVGWILDPGAERVGTADIDFATTSESVLAIVSVPAWWTELKLRIEKSLLDRWGDMAPAGAPQTYTVGLPYRSASIDALLIADSRRGPVITAVDCTVGVASDTDDRPTAHIMIQGHNLWRNTAVTLGGIKATSIEVLPNMKGILARFRGLDHRDAPAAGTLRVWTSEGVTETETAPEDAENFCNWNDYGQRPAPSAETVVDAAANDDKAPDSSVPREQIVPAIAPVRE